MNVHALSKSSKPVVVETKRRKIVLSPPLNDNGHATAVDRAVAASISRLTSGITSEVRLVTPDDARYMRDNFHFDRQRKISPQNVQRLSAEMLIGRFIPGTQIYICDLPDGTSLIINGNHTLEAVFLSDVPQLMTVTRKLVADANEAGRLYAVFDIHKARTWLDSLKATGLQEDNGNNSAKVLAAMGVIENRFEQHGPAPFVKSRLDRIARMEEYQEASKLLFAGIEGCPKETGNYIRRAAVLAVAIETVRYQPSAALDFWRSFTQDNGLTPGMPERALLGFLRNNRGGTGAASRKVQARAAALAWNASFRGDEIQHVKPGQVTSFYLLGTPWAKGLNNEAE